MRDYNGYKLIEHGPISQAKLAKVGKTGKLSFTKEELQGCGFKTLFHPANAKMIKHAKSKSKGVIIPMSGGEIINDMNFHKNMGSGMEGGSIWSWLKDKAFPWLKQNVWPAVKPIVSGLVDQGATMLGNYTGQPGLVQAARSALKDVSGVGVKSLTTHDKRLAALAKARAAKAMKRGKGSGLYL